MLRLAIVLSFALPIALAPAAAAQVEQRRVVYDMEADVIEGARLNVPDVPIVSRPVKHTHRNLIQVRTSFSQELLASASKI